MQPFTTLNTPAAERSARPETTRTDASDRGDHDRFHDAFDRARQHRADRQAPRDRATAEQRAAAARDTPTDRADGARRAAAAGDVDVAAYAREHRSSDDANGSSSVAGLAVLGVPVAGLLEQHRGGNLEVAGGDGAAQLDEVLEELDAGVLPALAGELGLSTEALLDAVQSLSAAEADTAADLAVDLAAELLADGNGTDEATLADAADLLDLAAQLAQHSDGDSAPADQIAQLLADHAELGDEADELADRIASLLADDADTDEAAVLAAVAQAQLAAALTRAGDAVRPDDALEDETDRLDRIVATLRAMADDAGIDMDGSDETAGSDAVEAGLRAAVAAVDTPDGADDADDAYGASDDEPEVDDQRTQRDGGRVHARAATTDRAHRGGDADRAHTTSTDARSAPPSAEPVGPPSTPPGRAGQGRAPSLPPGVQRVLEAVEQLERLAPPRQLTLDLGELRVRVAMEEGQVRLSVLDGDARDGEELLEDARQALAGQGFDLGGDAEHADADGDDDRPGAAAGEPTDRSRTRGRRDDTGLRL